MKQNKKQTILDRMSRNELATNLYQISATKKLVQCYVNKFRSHPTYSMIFSEDSVRSDLNWTIASVVNRVERYSKTFKNPYSKVNEPEMFNAYCEGFKTTDENPYVISENFDEKLSEAFSIGREDICRKNNQLRLETDSDIEGYFVKAFKNRMVKTYAEHKRQKRNCEKMVFLDDSRESSGGNERKQIKSQLDALASHDPEKDKNFKNIMTEIALHLRSVDKKNNRIKETNDSKLASMFCSIVNEKKNMDSEDLRENFDWSSYLVRKNKKEIIEIVRSKFMDHKQEILQYLDDRAEISKAS